MMAEKKTAQKKVYKKSSKLNIGSEILLSFLACGIMGSLALFTVDALIFLGIVFVLPQTAILIFIVSFAISFSTIALAAWMLPNYVTSKTARTATAILMTLVALTFIATGIFLGLTLIFPIGTVFAFGCLMLSIPTFGGVVAMLPKSIREKIVTALEIGAAVAIVVGIGLVICLMIGGIGLMIASAFVASSLSGTFLLVGFVMVFMGCLFGLLAVEMFSSNDNIFSSSSQNKAINSEIQDNNALEITEEKKALNPHKFGKETPTDTTENLLNDKKTKKGKEEGNQTKNEGNENDKEITDPLESDHNDTASNAN